VCPSGGMLNAVMIDNSAMVAEQSDRQRSQQEYTIVKIQFAHFQAKFMLSAVAGIMAASFNVPAATAQETTVIELTQTGCQFLESENGIDHAYVTAKSADCEAINARTGKERLAKAVVLTLKPGDYVFRVINKNVPYELGFWLRDHDYRLGNVLDKLTKTSISGGGITMGKAQDYEVSLKPGEYLYSCPLNPTPNYRLIVSES